MSDAHVRLSGALTAATAPQLLARLRAAVASGETAVTVDLQAVSGFDAAGVAALLEARALLHGTPGGKLVLRMNAITGRALKAAGVARAFAVGNTAPGDGDDG
jgi:anti-anti-sigma factor